MYRYLKAEFRQPTPEELANPLTVVTEAAKAPEGIDPAGALGAMVKGVVTIEALNRPFMLATVKGPQGNFLTLPVEDASFARKTAHRPGTCAYLRGIQSGCTDQNVNLKSHVWMEK